MVLDAVVQQLNNGSEPEAIAGGFPTLNLADVDGTIADHLLHSKDVDVHRGRTHDQVAMKSSSSEDRAGVTLTHVAVWL